MLKAFFQKSEFTPARKTCIYRGFGKINSSVAGGV